MNEHTSGPWVRDGFNLSVILHQLRAAGDHEAVHICGDYEEVAVTRGDNWDANARLIAAAPDLLAACEMLAEWLSREEAGFPDAARLCDESQRLAHLAITKAKGVVK